MKGKIGAVVFAVLLVFSSSYAARHVGYITKPVARKCGQGTCTTVSVGFRDGTKVDPLQTAVLSGILMCNRLVESGKGPACRLLVAKIGKEAFNFRAVYIIGHPSRRKDGWKNVKLPSIVVRYGVFPGKPKGVRISFATYITNVQVNNEVIDMWFNSVKQSTMAMLSRDVQTQNDFVVLNVVQNGRFNKERWIITSFPKPTRR